MGEHNLAPGVPFKFAKTLCSVCNKPISFHSVEQRAACRKKLYGGKPATDSRRARLHRALDCVLDRSAVAWGRDVANWQRKDMGAWGDRLEEERLERLAEATKTRKPKMCALCREGNHISCLANRNHDRRLCSCQH